MGRPSKNTSIHDEKRLTFAVCQLIFFNSGLSFSDLEKIFSIGTLTASKRDKKTGKTFSRYCKRPVPKSLSTTDESRAAKRSDLQRFVRIAIEQGWITELDIQELHLDPLLQLSSSTKASEVFDERKKEIENLVEKFNKLSKALDDAQEALNLAKYFRYKQARFGATLNRLNPAHQILWDAQIYVFVEDDGREIIGQVPEGCYVHNSVPFALSALRAHIDDSQLSLKVSELSIDAVFENKNKNKKTSKKVVLSEAECAKLAADIDELMSGLEI